MTSPERTASASSRPCQSTAVSAPGAASMAASGASALPRPTANRPCSTRAAKHRGAELVNEPGAWAMSRLNTRDPKGAKEFYGAIFGWKFDTFEAGEMEVTLWRLPGYVGGEPQQPVPRDVVGVMTPMGDRFPDEATPHWSVDFWVHDVDAAAARAAEIGGTVLAAPFDSPVGRTAVLADPLGAMLSVSKVNG